MSKTTALGLIAVTGLLGCTLVGCTLDVAEAEQASTAQQSAALVRSDFPSGLLMEHHNWHMGSQVSEADRGVDFLAFHSIYLQKGSSWFLAQGVNPAELARWTQVPSALKSPNLGWSSSLAAQETRLLTNNPPFAGESDLGNFIESAGIHGWLHGAAATHFNEPVLGTFDSPQSSHFYQIHGLVDFYWERWRQLSYDPLAGGPSAVMAPSNRLVVFARSASNKLAQRYYQYPSSGWAAWSDLDAGLASGPSAVMAGTRLTVFARGAKNVLLHKYYENGWTNWIPLDGSTPGPDQIASTSPGTMTSAPSAVMAANNRLTVFARGPGGTLMHRYYDNNAWTGWISMGGAAITSAPSAVMANGRLTVFARAADGTLTHRYYDNGWTGWISLGGAAIASAPSAVMAANNRLTVFARAANGTLTHRYYENNAWTGWIALGGAAITSAPAAVMANGSQPLNRLTVFARAADNTLVHRYYDNGWTGWIPLQGSL
jgi:hypothetical protein